VESWEKQWAANAIPQIVNTNFHLEIVATAVMFIKPDILNFIVARN
jgi:hypothetical protein